MGLGQRLLEVAESVQELAASAVPFAEVRDVEYHLLNFLLLLSLFSFVVGLKQVAFDIGLVDLRGNFSHRILKLVLELFKGLELVLDRRNVIDFLQSR